MFWLYSAFVGFIVAARTWSKMRQNPQFLVGLLQAIDLKTKKTGMNCA
ncbi:hypothetical protein [Methylomonas koyamae]|nr:hypothetical protein [Methylomonas koyamae]